MANIDQAEGLRRMLESPKPRVLTCISACPDEEKSELLVNLGVSLARQGRDVLMVDARSSRDSVGAWLNAYQHQTLLDVARQQRSMIEAIKPVSAGLSVTMLSQYLTLSSSVPTESLRRLSRVFDLVVNRAQWVMVDCEVDQHDAFPLASFDDAEIIVQVSRDPATIKAAYTMIKRISGRVGRRSYGIVVSGATETEARLVFANMALAAQRYLAVTLNFVGHIPKDAELKKAARIGRSVVDAFPLATASQAFCKIADQLLGNMSNAARHSTMNPMGWSGGMHAVGM
jgi:flagellar biosynthesis protein FlhG